MWLDERGAGEKFPLEAPCSENYPARPDTWLFRTFPAGLFIFYFSSKGDVIITETVESVENHLILFTRCESYSMMLVISSSEARLTLTSYSEW